MTKFSCHNIYHEELWCGISYVMSWHKPCLVLKHLFMAMSLNVFV